MTSHIMLAEYLRFSNRFAAVVFRNLDAIGLCIADVNWVWNLDKIGFAPSTQKPKA